MWTASRAVAHRRRSMVGKGAQRFTQRPFCVRRLCPPYTGPHSAVLLLRNVEHLAAHQMHGRLVIELNVVERVGDDLGEPHEARLHVLEEEQVHGAEHKPTEPNREPDQRGVVREGREIVVWLEQAEYA